MYTIGHVARAASCKVQTIRYYEQIGLLPVAPRSEGNRRLYAQADIDRLMFIRHARELGFALDAIRDLLSLSDDPNQPCVAADAIARRQLDEVERRIARLGSLKTELMRMIDQCRGGRISDCRVIEVLSNHAHCMADDHRPTEAKP
ncbi:MerR family transcriptional regulator [Iodidimonas nitroreducens]|jgi:Cu(I)-responsive transcriptional regulator|uniref:MerR family transcriptional regulator n=1 Tax=Iodidimonas nitroreducens TaxID=1236968 RepID=A0A5A7NB59_9PROT|nr:helix-turn-helix domain-containing protein [Iodidimonas nitroreducens]PKP78075.1 MAG: MerR family transcriptional regulator [Alphaproteobacteria bacterium HGW-Alphaproteobacteria-3]GAK33932.1 HTH-type transcriptional regulator ZntR [alpha proteobacterium Q-1]GER05633.1 MerR family transcriptional regulator [Iodidimonas nitroreducens]